MRVGVASDEELPVLESILTTLLDLGHEVQRVGVGEEWPEVGHRLGEMVASGELERGVVCCWTGTGVAMAANKVPGVRAALCGDPETAAGARRWNDANVLALSLRLTSPTLAEEIVRAFMTSEVDVGEHAAIDRLEPRAVRE